MRIAIAMAMIVLTFGSSDSNAQQATAKDAMVKFLTQLEALEDNDFVLSLSGVSNDSGPIGVVLAGMAEHQAFMVFDKDKGELLKSWTTALKRPSFSPIDNKVSLNIPTGCAIRKVRDKSGELITATAKYNRWDGMDWHGPPFRKANAILPGFPKGNIAFFGLYPYMEFQMQEIDAAFISKHLHNLKLENEQMTKDGDVASTWLYDENVKARFNLVFSKSFDWLPISIEIEPFAPDGSKTKVWDAQIEWQSRNGRFYQKRCKSRDYFPNGKVYEIDLNFEWVLSSEIPDGFFDRITSLGFNPETEQFNPAVSWIKGCDDLFARN